MNQQQVLNKLDRAWTALQESVEGLTPEQLLEPGVIEAWSVKDILAHITVWEEEALKHMPEILQGVRPPLYSVVYGGLNEFNALMTEKKRELSISDVLHQLEETHNRLRKYVRSAPEELFVKETRFRRRLRLDTYSHYPLHTKAILEWRRQKAI
jgi:hypothetical protein